MKKSEITVSMPITTYEEFIKIKEKYESLVRHIIECYDTNNHKINPAEPIRFDSEKAIAIFKEFLPYTCRDVEIVF